MAEALKPGDLGSEVVPEAAYEGQRQSARFWREGYDAAEARCESYRTSLEQIRDLLGPQPAGREPPWVAGEAYDIARAALEDFDPSPVPLGRGAA